MVLKIIYLICVILVSIVGGAFISFAISKLGEINTKKDSIPKRHLSKGWINLYKNEDGISWISPNYFTSKKEAEEEAKTHTCSVTTIKIEWEE